MRLSGRVKATTQSMPHRMQGGRHERYERMPGGLCRAGVPLEPGTGRRCRVCGAKTVSDGSIVVDRDMNGARGIMLRALYGNLGRSQAAGAEVALVAE